MSNHFVFEGLDELRDALRTLPADLTGEASHVVEAAANGAAASIKAGYPDRTGDLRDHVFVDPFYAETPFASGYIVRNTAPLAWIFENGTQARQTAIGADRGSMPPGHVFIPIAAAKRRQMDVNLLDLVTRHGLIGA